MIEQPSATPAMDWDAVCRFNEAIFNGCLDQARTNLKAGRAEECLRWCRLAASWSTEKGFFGKLASESLEHLLSELAKLLPEQQWQRSGGTTRFLHVFDEAYSIFGHTALCVRWMQAAPAMTCHSVVALSQSGSLPPKLVDAVVRTGGRTDVLAPGESLFQQAGHLRKICREQADVVVLHTHPDCVVASVALSVSGGPPVVMVNHADHLFHVGRAVADLTFDIRDSGHDWTLNHRGVPHAQIVPIPLGDANPQDDDAAAHARVRAATRQALGIPDEAVVLLTIGAAYKYVPVGGISFFQVQQPVLEKFPRVYLLAVGPHDTGHWNAMHRTTGGRVLALGRQQGLERFHAAADIYLEGFPFGSLTAILEAGLAGLASVRTPAMVPPPFCCDGVAFAELDRAATPEDYQRRLAALIENPKLRKESGAAFRARIVAHHCGTNWVQLLEAALAKLPHQHRGGDVRPAKAVPRVPRNYWLRWVLTLKGALNLEESLTWLFAEAALRGISLPEEFGRDCAAQLQLTSEALSGERAVAPPGRVAPDADAASKTYARLLRESQDRRLLKQVFNALERGDSGAARRCCLTALLRRPGVLCDREFQRGTAKAFLGERLLNVAKQLQTRKRRFD
jgi:hypothetical protein